VGLRPGAQCKTEGDGTGAGIDGGGVRRESAMSSVPGNLQYTDEHEWVLVEDEIATVGISDFAQNELGDITFVELPEDDVDIAAGDEAATIESVKAASPVYAPVSGRIAEVNVDLEESPENINQDPFGAGWIFRVEMSDASELDKLMDAEAYEAFLEKAEEEGD
jgi:glycine cleavage system H protein